jgi:prepilin-type processing-associated H-X9-DG protein
MRPSSDVVLIAEKRVHNGPSEVPAAENTYFDGQYSSTNRLITRTLARIHGDFQRFTSRHKNGGFLLFADGHVDFALHHDVLTARVKATSSNGGGADFNKPGMIWNPYGAAN